MIDAVLNNDNFGQEGFVRGNANLSFSSNLEIILGETVEDSSMKTDLQLQIKLQKFNFLATQFSVAKQFVHSPKSNCRSH